MATARRTLGQAKPAAATDGTLLTVTAAHDYVVSSIVCTETTATPGAATIVRVCADAAGGTATAAGKALFWEMAIGANGTLILAIGATLEAGATIIVRSLSGTVNFTAYGQDNS